MVLQEPIGPIRIFDLTDMPPINPSMSELLLAGPVFPNAIWRG